MRRVRRADNLTTTCDPIAKQYGILNIPQPYRPSRLVTGIAILFTFYISNTLGEKISTDRII
jgi:hypothetical protein